ASYSFALIFFVIYLVSMVSKGLVPKFDSSFPIWVLTFVLISNALPDYVSLLETRYILSLMKRTNRFSAWVVLVLVDAILTAYISAVGLFAAIRVVVTVRRYLGLNLENDWPIYYQ